MVGTRYKMETSLQQRLSALTAVWLAGFIVLLALGNQSDSEALFSKYDQLRTIYQSTAASFCFAIALDALAFTYAISTQKKSLALVLGLVDGIACLTYVLSANTNLYYFIDEFDNPVWVFRYAEWFVTCPALLMVIAMASSASMDQMMDLMTYDIFVNVFGLLSSVWGGLAGQGCFAVASAFFGLLIVRLYNIVIESSNADRKPVVSTAVLRVILLEVFVTWSVFPAIELCRRMGALDYQTGEGLMCLNDGAAKVGLALILFTYNLDAYLERDTSLREALGESLKIVTRTGVDLTTFKALNRLDDDVKSWFNQEYNGLFRRKSRGSVASLTDKSIFSIMPSVKNSSSIEQSDFSTLNLSPSDLVKVTVRMFDQLALLKLYGISKSAMTRFVQQVRGAYKDIPYHNFAHAVQGLHFVYIVLRSSGAQWCRDLEVLALMLATLLRNVGHSALTNDYHVRMRTELAMLYNDVSVTEHHHCSRAFALLLDGPDALLHRFDHTTVTELRHMIIDCILSTDVTTNQAQLTILHQHTANGCTKERLDKDKDLRRLMIKSLTCTADLAMNVLPFHQAKAWAQRLQCEYNHQAECELALGFEPQPFLTKTSDEDIAQAQMLHFTLIARPWIETLSNLLPDYDFLIDNLDANYKHWESIAEEA
uniref:Rhodopsin-phosphodiesterase fusion protein 1 n=1 Tax=Choanoeca flexa TaxID=2572930 RepID=A0A513ZS49_9EUKA|nr:rhodopsin-phosphodiesterase fusion protein 1 [Choanoeca flexa]|eukprot:TRINITY_DN8267_c0_g1_i1.p1 TRINITY_DN8267_c0_g1~~TRINITY_DN8267_c0_g1_i1.p1  ORF type:complete len:653 (+),score=153.14 TRINITY_DN8267_c0_g1_i1:107-2065(+)